MQYNKIDALEIVTYSPCPPVHLHTLCTYVQYMMNHKVTLFFRSSGTKTDNFEISLSFMNI